MPKQEPTTKGETAKAEPALALGPAMPGPAMPQSPRMDVVDYIKWGNLIKSWSRNPESVPKDIQDFKDQCQAAGVGLSMPNSFTEMRVILQKDNEFILRIPPANAIKETEVALEAGGLYPVPNFYNQRFGSILNIQGKKESLDFHAQRIGDYIIRLTA
ncbi:hypothetical protein [Reyranella sp.]|uniref:hypothetical protein n=1 Tax=Reyranella sp. TaxID=1929291 RepID=UPI003D1473EE